MIDLNIEKNMKLTTKEIQSICDFSIQAAKDEGFLSTYVFERAIYVFAAVILYPDIKDKTTELISSDYDISFAWDMLVKNGTVDKMIKEYPEDIEYLTQIGNVWLQDAVKYSLSARGILDIFSNMSGDILQQAVNRLQEVTQGEGAKIQEFAETWGFNRPLANVAEEKE